MLNWFHAYLSCLYDFNLNSLLSVLELVQQILTQELIRRVKKQESDQEQVEHQPSYYTNFG